MEKRGDEEVKVMVLLIGEVFFPTGLIDLNRAILLFCSSRHSFQSSWI